MNPQLEIGNSQPATKKLAIEKPQTLLSTFTSNGKKKKCVGRSRKRAGVGENE
jgi:hypothetical protein